MFGSKMLIGITFLFVLCSAALPAAGDTYYVRPNGNDQAPGSTARSAFRSVRRAAQALNHGDSIVVAPGVYREPAFFAERFSADGAQMAIIGDESGRLTGTAPGPVIVEANDPTRPALHFYRLRNLRISGLTLRGTGQGLKVEKCNGVIVERSTFDGLTRGLIASGTNGLRVETSVFKSCTIGAFVQRSVQTRIAHVTVAGSSSVGLLVLSSGAGEITNSILAENNANLIADQLSAPGWSSDYNVILGTNGPWGDVPAIAKVYEWNAISGQDRHSMHVVPAFADPAAMNLRIAPDVTWCGGLPGMNVGQALDPPVRLDRDGKALRIRNGTVCAGAYDYPDPRPAPGWRKLGVQLDGDGPRQSAAVYRDDGTLVRTLLADSAGVSELWWDGLDDLGTLAGPGRYQVKSVEHDVRIVDDGAMGDDGNPMGAYNCDNADRVVALPDGGFIITTIYDEAGYALRGYSSTGQPIFANNLSRKDYTALALDGEELYGIVNRGRAAAIMRHVLPGERVHMLNGAESYPLFAAGENGEATGLAVAGDTAYATIATLNVVRLVDLKTGAKKADHALAGVGDITRASNGTLWAISGTDVVALTADGKAGKRYATGLASPRYVAASPTRLAIVDRSAARLAILDAANGKMIRTFGTARAAGQWQPVTANALRDPRDAAFLPDGRLVLTEHARVRIMWPETGTINQDILSNFMDVAVVHPTQPEYVYCSPGVFRVDPKTGAWKWLVEAPSLVREPGEGDDAGRLRLGQPATTVALDGRPFIAYFGAGTLRMMDVTDPLKPRLALECPSERRVFAQWAYATIAFTKGGDILAGGHYGLGFKIFNYLGLDEQNNPMYDLDNPADVGTNDDPTPRGMKAIAALAGDRATGDIYYLAVTDRHNKMVPAWGADGTGVGRSTPEGKPLWFALSSGGNYMSISTTNDGTLQEPGNAWVFAGKSFGGQIDLFDADGLRLTTGNWGWPCNYTIGFVDLRFGVYAYMRPDGKPGAYVEDDAIGRFGRCRVDGAGTLRKRAAPLDWQPAGAVPGNPPVADAVAGESLARMQTIPRITEMKIDGNWDAWEEAGVVPQIIALPVAGFRRSFPDDLWQTFRAGTAIGAVAHDGRSFYVYFLVADDTMHFDADAAGTMWMYDSVELWLEEEQIGLGFVKDGTTAIFKYRYHDRAGKEWSANYSLAQENVWGAKLNNLSSHPLGRRLATITGVSFEGKSGYALMGRIPFEEVKLVGGIAGRGGKEVIDTTGKPGEVVRIGVAFGGISAWGREQDYKVNWPSALMFSDPTRSVPFALGK
jgi:hypothetical protein